MLTLAEFPEHSTPGLWIGVSVPSVVQFSRDRETWHRAAAIRFPAAIGLVQEWPVVEMTGTLRSSADPLASPLLWVGGELMAVGSADLLGDGQYRLDKLVRGLRGTAQRDHPAGAEVMLLDQQAVFVALHRAMIGVPLWWRAVPDGESTGLARPYTAQGLVCPRLDGSRPSVQGLLPEPPTGQRWGERWLVVGSGRGEWTGWGGDVAAWLDGWYRERPEIGTRVFDRETGEMLVRRAEGWS